MIPKNVDELEKFYRDAEETDKELYAEMRSNILLISGQHYTRNVNKHFARLRETNRLTETLKLRLTKNHIHKVHRYYTNAIVGRVPGVSCSPNNESEMQDTKSAELNNLVLDDIKRRHKFKDKIRRWCGEYTGIGEVAVKVFWDPNKGDLVGYEQKLDEQTNQPLYLGPDGQPTTDSEIPEVPGVPGNPYLGIPDQPGQPAQPFEAMPDESLPVFSGDHVFEPVFGFNLWRAPGSKSMEDSPYLGIRKMVPMSELKSLYKNDEEKMKKIHKSTDTDYIVFDSSKSEYEKKEKWTLLKECYWKPSYENPKGYFKIWTEFGILEEGELPNGIFPIKWKGFDEYPSTPRGRSIIKVCRPYQAELNRAASQRATHQITLGDDKVLYQSGTKLAPGALLPGVRGISYQGAAPQILAGRNGDQYAGYVQEEKNDMYEAAMINEMTMDESNSVDPYTMLFKTISQQAKYKQYIEKFEEFVVEVHELALELARYYMPDDRLQEIFGPQETVNMGEFKRQGKLRYMIKVVAQSDSVDTMMGKQITFTHLLQYLGNKLPPDQIGLIIRNMPFVNNEEMFSDMTIDYDNVKNDMLALERGEQVQVAPYAKNEYYIGRLTHRMKQPDFKFLQPQVQSAYQTLTQQHQQEVVRKEQAIIDAKNEYIPVGGAMVAIDMYVPNEDPTKQPKRARVPYQAMEWLMGQLDKQGMSLDKLENMNQGALADMAQQLTAGRQEQANEQQLQVQQFN